LTTAPLVVSFSIFFLFALSTVNNSPHHRISLQSQKGVQFSLSNHEEEEEEEVKE
jgi:hypothetical protein